MNYTLIKNARFYRENKLWQNLDILINDQEILQIDKNISFNENVEIVNADNNLLTPGFIDLQINGGGKTFFNNNVTLEALTEIQQAHQKDGTRYFLPTLISSELPKILTTLPVVEKAMKSNSAILGLHLEGPFFNIEKHGGHNPTIIRKPSDEELDTIIEKGQGIIKKITIAPEIFTPEQLKRLLETDFIISAGHSNANLEEALGFFDSGINCVTHLYNAMSPFLSKAPGLVGAAFVSKVFAGIIVDGIHSHYQAVEIAYKLLGDHLFLVSDASFTNVEDFETAEIEGLELVIKNGEIRTRDGKLAGAAITLLDAIKNCVTHVKIEESEAIRMATYTPAKVLGLSHKIGSITVGNSSKLNLLDQGLSIKYIINQSKEVRAQ